MELTTRVRKIMEKYSIEPEDVIYCDLINSGWGKIEAAYYAFKLTYPDPKRINQFMREQTRQKPGINKMIDDYNEQIKEDKKKLKMLEEKISKKEDRLKKEAEKDKEVTAESLRSKQGMLDYLIDMAATPGLDIKTRTELAKQISDLQQYKKEEVHEEEERVHYFLPLTCAKCSLYAAEKERQRQERINNDKPNDNGTQE